MDSVQHAKAGHPGMALGMAEVGYILYRHVMRYNPKNPKWFNRDRFVLSAGHGCLLQYVCLHLAGFQSVQVDVAVSTCLFCSLGKNNYSLLYIVGIVPSLILDFDGNRKKMSLVYLN